MYGYWFLNSQVFLHFNLRIQQKKDFRGPPDNQKSKIRSNYR